LYLALPDGREHLSSPYRAPRPRRRYNSAQGIQGKSDYRAAGRDLAPDVDGFARAAAEAGRVRIAIGRASDFFGPGITESALGERVFAKALARKSADFLGNPDLPHTYSYVPDVAAGRAFHPRYHQIPVHIRAGRHPPSPPRSQRPSPGTETRRACHDRTEYRASA
jgi:hypothetical protein